jgi:hypothetical protein
METSNAGPFQKRVHVTRRLIPDRVGVPDLEVVARVFEHLSRWVGPVKRFLTDRCDDTIHLDFFVADPTVEHPFQTVLSAGMSSAPMSHPEVQSGRLWWAELFFLLPPDWPLDEVALREDKWSWPLQLTCDMDRMPHIADSWLWHGHLFELAGPRGPICEGVPFFGAFLAETDLLPPGFHSFSMRPGKEVGLHCVLPILGPEMAFANQRGTFELLDRMNDRGISDVIDCRRESAV